MTLIELFAGNRSPSLTDQIKANGVGFDLTGSTVKLRMRAEGGSALLVDTAATIVNAATGQVQYNWAAQDVATAGRYVAWWQVTLPSGFTQDSPEFPVLIAGHTPVSPTGYLTAAELKATLTMTGTSFADADVTLAIGAASRAVDHVTGRRFWLDTGTTNIRYYTPNSYRLLQIDDLVTMTSVTIDRAGSGTFSESWVNGTDYVLEPFNAPSAQPARPYETLRVRMLSGRWLPQYIEQSVKVTGQFGWTSVPDDVTAATGILAAKLLRRGREAPFGIVTAGIDSGVAMRIARTDPDVYTLLADYNRHELFV